MQTTFALLEAVFGRKKKGVKYLRRLLFGHKPCPITYLHGAGAQEFGEWLKVLSSQTAIISRASRRKSLYDQYLCYRQIYALTPQLLEDHLVYAIQGQKQLITCELTPILLSGIEDPEVAVFEVASYPCDEIKAEVPIFVQLLLDEVDYWGRPNPDFLLSI